LFSASRAGEGEEVESGGRTNKVTSNWNSSTVSACREREREREEPKKALARNKLNYSGKKSIKCFGVRPDDAFKPISTFAKPKYSNSYSN
jgi:hypothetical protein